MPCSPSLTTLADDRSPHEPRNAHPMAFKEKIRNLISDVSRTTAISSDVVNQDLFHILWRRAAEDSADFLEPFLDRVMLFRSLDQIRSYAISSINPEGLLMEFGVWFGGSINFFGKRISDRKDGRKIHGFDSFQGLVEEWHGHYIMPDDFSQQGVAPQVLPNVELVIGVVEQKLPEFLATHPGPIAFIHVDTDTYSTARFILEQCGDRFVSGTTILFDDYLGFPNWRNGEHKALLETLPADSWEYRAFAKQQALVRIK
jgi:hypothetical protein